MFLSGQRKTEITHSPSGRYLLVAIPAYDYKIDIRLAAAIVGGGRVLEKQGHMWAMTSVGGCSVLPKARNELVADFMDMPEATDLLFIDADTTFPALNIPRILEMSDGRDIVCGVVPQKLEDTTFRVRIKEPYVSEDGLLEVERVGAAFMLVRRHVIEELNKHYPTSYNSDTKRDHHILFDFTTNEEGYLGEDYTFCDRAREHGFRVWVDPLLSFDHIGTKAYHGRLADHLPG